MSRSSHSAAGQSGIRLHGPARLIAQCSPILPSRIPDTWPCRAEHVGVIS
jgi:hypothetical protein